MESLFYLKDENPYPYFKIYEGKLHWQNQK